MVINKKAFAVLTLTVCSAFLGSAAGYLYTVNKYSAKEGIDNGAVTEENKEEEAEEEIAEVSSKEEKIVPSTKMVYRYKYTEDGVVEEVEEEPSYFLLDLSLSDLLKYYATWDIVSFSSKEVVMEKTIYGPSMQRYVVGEKDGYIAVFYEEEQNGISLKELTSIPVDGLNEEERLRLKQGVPILGKDALARTLENYSS